VQRLHMRAGGVEPYLNPVQRRTQVRSAFETDLSEVCAPRQCNVGLLAYSPLAGGALSGKYLQGGQGHEKARFNIFPGYMERCARVRRRPPGGPAAPALCRRLCGAPAAWSGARRPGRPPGALAASRAQASCPQRRGVHAGMQRPAGRACPAHSRERRPAAGLTLTCRPCGARYNKSLAREAVAQYAKVAEKHGLTPTQLALAWCKSRWNVASTIIGATSMEQLKVRCPQTLTLQTLIPLHAQVTLELCACAQASTRPCRATLPVPVSRGATGAVHRRRTSRRLTSTSRRTPWRILTGCTSASGTLPQSPSTTEAARGGQRALLLRGRL